MIHRIEAEEAILSDGYVAEDRAEASNGKVARLLKSASNGTIRYNFAYESGEYELFVRYADEIDGACSSTLKIENVVQDEWKWDTAVASDIYVYRRIGAFQINTGDEIALWTLRDDGEYARVDYFEFKSVEQPQEAITVVQPNGGESWVIGSSRNIIWTSSGTSGAVNIELSRDNGASWETIQSNVTDNNGGTLAWDVTGPASSTCLVRVIDADGAPADTSDAVFAITEPATPSITVASPNGGETWLVGTNQTIAWTSENTSGAVKIELSRNSGTSWETLTENTTDDGAFDWTVTEPASANCLVRIADVTAIAADTSDNTFTIARPTITVISPNGGESWEIGSTQQIEWRQENVTGTVKIELSRDSGATWETLAADVAGAPDETGLASMSWVVTGPESETCLVQVSATNGSAGDISDAVFAVVVPPSITVTAPNGGEKWQIGESYNITWTSEKIQGDVKVELSRDNGAAWETLTDATPNDGLLEWTVSAPASGQCLVKVSSADGAVSDMSDAVFSIIEPPEITVVSPNGGETWTIGTQEQITWRSVSTSGQVKIEISRDNGAAWEEIIDATDDDGSYDWTVTLPASESCVIKVSDIAGPAADMSDATFTIQNPPEPVITVIQPNGGEKWNINTEQVIKWFSKDIGGGVSVELSRDSGATWETLADSVEISADDSGVSQMTWTVSGPASDVCLVKITARDGSARDVSDAEFVIAEAPAITVVAPNGGESWEIGSTQEIKWSSINVDGPVKIELTRNGEIFETITESTDNTGSFRWTTTGPVSDSCLVRISAGDVADSSDAFFAIVAAPVINVVSPNGGEKWSIGENYEIAWSSVNTSGFVDIELTRDNGVTWETLADSIADDGSFTWTVVGPTSNACLVRIADADGAPTDVSDALFSIIEHPSLTLLTPAADDVWKVGSNQDVTWESVNIGDKIKIELSRDGGDNWETLIANTSNSGSWTWTVQQPVSDNCYIRITDVASGLSDKNDGAFLIKFPTGVAKIDGDIPDDFALLQNYPNPFNPETRITYQLPERADVTVQVYNIQGGLVATLVSETQSAGTYMITWNGKDDSGAQMPSGVYFYRIAADNFNMTKRMMLMK